MRREQTSKNGNGDCPIKPLAIEVAVVMVVEGATNGSEETVLIDDREAIILVSFSSLQLVL
jgi:hypothetical protein